MVCEKSCEKKPWGIFGSIWPGSWGENLGVFRQQSLKCSLEQIFAVLGRSSSSKCNIYFCLGEEKSVSNSNACI